MSKKADANYAAKKKLVLKELAEGGTTQAALAEKHEVSTVTIGRWAKGKSKRAGKKRKGKPARAYAARNGKANGHALPPPSAPSLETVRAELARALASVDALREAYGRVFGGSA
jgi:transposase-like protein